MHAILPPSTASRNTAFAYAAPPAYTTQMLDNRNQAHLDHAVDLIAEGEIVAFGFNGIFAFLGDADQPVAARRMAAAKGQSVDKTLALVCPPEHLDEFVDLQAPAFARYPMGKLQQLQCALHGLGVILPVAPQGVPPYATENGTVLNVWFEYPPLFPARYLHRQLRLRGVRAMIGTSANRHGEATYVDPQHALRVFGGSIPAILAHDLRGIAPQHRQSSTLVDFTGAQPRLVRHGSVPVKELAMQLRALGLPDLAPLVPAPVRTSATALH